MRLSSIRVWVVLLATLLVAGCGTGRGLFSPGPRAAQGVLDLRTWDPVRDGPVRMDGDWEFYWNQLAPPPAPVDRPGYFRLPASWNGAEWAGSPLPGTGYATFRLRVRLDRPMQGLAVRLAHALTAYTLAVDGRIVARNGVVGTATESRPEWRPGVYPLPNLGTQSEWVLTISNFHDYKGGPWRPLILGTAEELNAARADSLVLELVISGVYLAVGMYHLVVFSFRRRERYALWFSLFAILMAVRLVSTQEFAIQQALPDVSWVALYRIQIFTWLSGLPLFTVFLRSLYPAEFPRFTVASSVAAWAFATAILLVLQPLALSPMVSVYLVLTVVGVGYWTVGMLVAARRRREAAGYILGGMLIFVAVILHDILYFREIVHTRYLAPLAVPPLVLAQALLLVGRSTRAFNIVETLQHSLEAKVEERTRDLSAKNVELEQTLAELRSTQGQLRQVGLSVRIGSEHKVFPYADILYLMAREKKTLIHTRTGEHDVNRPLKEIESLLAPEVFLRIHRQCIVNVSFVAEVTHIGGGGYIAVLRGREDVTLPVSRAVAAELRDRLGTAAPLP